MTYTHRQTNYDACENIDKYLNNKISKTFLNANPIISGDNNVN